MAGQVRRFSGLSMGTSWSVSVVAGGAAPHLQLGLQGVLDQVVAQMSHWQPDSDLARFNRAAAGSWQAIPADFFAVLTFALAVGAASGGAYDPCAGALIERWGFGASGRYDQPGFVPPGAAEVAQLLAQRRAGVVRLEHGARRAWQPGGIALDLSAVAKGYAVDLLADYLQRLAIRHYLVEVGGELRGAGTKPDGQPWWVALEQVDDGTAQTGLGGPGQMVLALHGLAVATSGDYRRYFTRQRQRFPHTLDPRSGMPIDNGVACVTVVHGQCMAADAWSTALTVLGAQVGMALAEQEGLAARFVLRGPDGLREQLSSQMMRMLAE